MLAYLAIIERVKRQAIVEAKEEKRETLAIVTNNVSDKKEKHR